MRISTCAQASRAWKAPSDGSVATRRRNRHPRPTWRMVFRRFLAILGPIVYFFSFSVTIIYAAGIFGRNFANPRFVFVQIFCVWTPMAAALLLYGNPYHWIYAGFSPCPFLGKLWQIDCAARCLMRRLHCGMWRCSQPGSMQRQTTCHMDCVCSIPGPQRGFQPKIVSANGIAEW